MKMCIFHIMLSLLDPLLAALARLMVARNVPFSDLAERLKGHYVRAATDLADGKITDSRLSVMTGLHRRDVARLRSFEPKPGKVHPLTRLVSLWQTDPAYAAQGEAIPLPRTGEAPSFDSLARAIRQDVHPRAMLDTLLDAGTVALSADESEVTLLQTAYLPPGGSDDQLGYLANNVGDHLAAATRNVLGGEPLFERALHYRGLTQEQVDSLEADFRAGQTDLLKTLNQKAKAMKDLSPTGGSHRLRAGAYLFHTAERHT
ncbi:DUF6502 family protein [Tropicibacter sp. S64]|uniref:DUF6502 family protein n=1 Tax=Tropicibacter sp. S64 TaxID=3415122 RepID=UPI003C7C7849